VAEMEPEPEPQQAPTPAPGPAESPQPRMPDTRVPRPRYDPVPLPLAAAPLTPPPPTVPSDNIVPTPYVFARPQISFDEATAAPMVPLPPNPAPLPVAQFAGAQQPYGLPLSSRPNAAPVSTRPCHNCSLEVSAKARFCRRCGSAQMAN
jgi:hypothetical protein